MRSERRAGAAAATERPRAVPGRGHALSQAGWAARAVAIRPAPPSGPSADNLPQQVSFWTSNSPLALDTFVIGKPRWILRNPSYRF